MSLNPPDAWVHFDNCRQVSELILYEPCVVYACSIRRSPRSVRHRLCARISFYVKNGQITSLCCDQITCLCCDQLRVNKIKWTTSSTVELKSQCELRQMVRSFKNERSVRLLRLTRNIPRGSPSTPLFFRYLSNGCEIEQKLSHTVNTAYSPSLN